MEDDFYNNFVRKYFLEDLSENDITNIKLLDWYKIFNIFLPQIIFCVIKKKNSSAMSLFSFDVPDLKNYGLNYYGILDISKLWDSLSSAKDFKGEDFYVCIYKEYQGSRRRKKNAAEPLKFNISSNGKLKTILRGTFVESECDLKREVDGSIYDNICNPDTILGGCYQTNGVYKFKNWVINRMLNDNSFIETKIEIKIE